MSEQSVEDRLQAAGSAVDLLRNSQIGPYAFPVVPSEFTNWRDEQRAWRSASTASRPSRSAYFQITAPGGGVVLTVGGNAAVGLLAGRAASVSQPSGVGLALTVETAWRY